MQYTISICADADIADAVALSTESAAGRGDCCNIAYSGVSFYDCLEPSIKAKANVLILQFKTISGDVRDLLCEMEAADFKPYILLFQVLGDRNIRYVTSLNHQGDADFIPRLLQRALDGKYECRKQYFRTTLWDGNAVDAAESHGRQECLREILRGCTEEEFRVHKKRYNLNLNDRGGFYLYVWELMGIEYSDHKINKDIYNFLADVVEGGFRWAMSDLYGGEVLYNTRTMVCVIVNSPAGKAMDDDSLNRLLGRMRTGMGKYAERAYMSEYINDLDGIRVAYNTYSSEKSLSFFLSDERPLRSCTIRGKRRHARLSDLNALLDNILTQIRYDIENIALDRNLHSLFYDYLKPAMSFPLYYYTSTALYSALLKNEDSSGFEAILEVNDAPHQIQFHSIEEQFDRFMELINRWRAARVDMDRIKDRLVLKAVQYIANNYSRQIMLTNISDALFVSNTHLCQVFKRHMGISVIKYLNNYRLDMAKQLLKDSDDYIYSVSGAVGFREFRYFSRLFKSSTGLLPTEYRNQYRGRYYGDL